MAEITFNDLLGEQLLQHGEPHQFPTSQLKGKTVALYFSAHWCPPCCLFTPKLAEIYKKFQSEFNDKFDIVFVSGDESQEAFDEYYHEMPWKALPFSDRDHSKQLDERFKVSSIPRLVVLSPKCEVLTNNGIDEIRLASEKPLHLWLKGESLCWSRQPNTDEHVWEDVVCASCYMYPLNGERYKCVDQECSFDLCDSCHSKRTHEHPLLKCLIPRKMYSLEEMFASIPYLLGPKGDDKIETKTLWKKDIKAIGFYFSGKICPSEHDIKEKLIQYYTELATIEHRFELVFVSWDENEQSFNEYRAQMPWPSIPFHFGWLFDMYFDYFDLPLLIVVSADGNILTRHGSNYIVSRGIDALRGWAKGEKLSPLSPDEFEWTGVGCDECGKCPFVGKRYRCSTCDNYDVCSACVKKGHEHSLELVETPSED